LGAAIAAPLRKSVLIGELLVDRGLIQPNDIDRALKLQAQVPGRFGAVLVRMGALSEESLLPVLAAQLGIPIAEGSDLPAARAAILAATGERLPFEWLKQQGALVWEQADGHIACGARNPESSFLRESISLAFPEKAVRWYFLRGQDLAYGLSLLDHAADTVYGPDDVRHLRELAEEAPVIELVNSMIAQAADERASDIHIEPDETTFTIRYRIDGVLQTRQVLPRDRFDAVASRIKLVSNLDIAERRLPQDGRFSTRAGGLEFDVRVSSIPAKNGESIVLRLLPKQRRDLDLAKLGLEPDHHALVQRWAAEPNGIVLVTGPTGSGKSTTLYTALKLANNGERKIITVEDPIEYKMPGIVQIQAHADIGYDFARALRSILRHDPDVIMVGEIRDRETAEIAIQAALTGHMVFSTLHTNSAVASFGRLLDMGIEPFLIASSVRAVVAQRLVRRLCPHCAIPVTPSAPCVDWWHAHAHQIGSYVPQGPQWRRSVGCSQCNHTGFIGRIGIYEIVPFVPEMHALVLDRAPAHALSQAAAALGARSMRDDGFIKAARGETTIDEVLRAVGDDNGDLAVAV
jgi:general secretion pathway protein E